MFLRRETTFVSNVGNIVTEIFKRKTQSLTHLLKKKSKGKMQFKNYFKRKLHSHNLIFPLNNFTEKCMCICIHIHMYVHIYTCTYVKVFISYK